jgi:hypothetical protein
LNPTEGIDVRLLCFMLCFIGSSPCCGLITHLEARFGLYHHRKHNRQRVYSYNDMWKLYVPVTSFTLNNGAEFLGRS